MRKRERIEALEKQVAELEKRLDEVLVRLEIAEVRLLPDWQRPDQYPWHLPEIITYDGTRAAGDTAQL